MSGTQIPILCRFRSHLGHIVVYAHTSACVCVCVPVRVTQRSLALVGSRQSQPEFTEHVEAEGAEVCPTPISPVEQYKFVGEELRPVECSGPWNPKVKVGGVSALPFGGGARRARGHGGQLCYTALQQLVNVRNSPHHLRGRGLGAG